MTRNDHRNKEVARGRIKRLASSGLPLEPFARGVFEVLNDAVPHSPNRVLLAGGGDSSDAYVGSTEEIARTTPLFRKYFVDSTSQDCGVRFPYDAHSLKTFLPSKAIWTQSDLLLENFFRADGYNLVYRPLGWHHLLQVVFQEAGEFIGYCPIWRSADQKPFSREDVEFLRNAAPHIAHGLRAAQLLESSQEPHLSAQDFRPLSSWRTGVILLDGSGRPIALDAHARLIFQQLGVLDGHSIDALSADSVRDGLAYVSQILAAIFRGTESESGYATAPVYRIHHHWTGIVLKLRGVRMIAADSREYFTVLVERGETADARRRRLMARWALSPREAEVLSLIAQNKTGPEIAILLGIGHDTVRKHTGHIFEKLGVETRAAATSIASNVFTSVIE